MKKIRFVLAFLVTLAICFILFQVAHAHPPMKTHTLIFKWDKNPDVNPDTQAKTTGYHIYYSHTYDALLPENFDYGKETSVRINEDDIPQPEEGNTVTYSYVDVPEGDYYFVCTAHNQNGTESPPSNIVHCFVDYNAPNSPQGFKLSITLTINQENGGE
jgi:hypothetical protein